MVQCPYCSSADSKVTDSRSVEESVRRRRECTSCGLRFTTYERVQSTALLVVKRDGRRQEFEREKLLASIVTACAKRPIPFRNIERIVQGIERQLQGMGRAEVPALAIGEMVMEQLRKLDRVAYVRWASVYRDFQDLESFERVVQDLKDKEKEPQEPMQLNLLDVGPTKRGRPKTRRQFRRTGAGSNKE